MMGTSMGQQCGGAGVGPGGPGGGGPAGGGGGGGTGLTSGSPAASGSAPGHPVPGLPSHSPPTSSAFKSVPSSCTNNNLSSASSPCPTKEVVASPGSHPHSPHLGLHHHHHHHHHPGMPGGANVTAQQQAAAAAHLHGLCPPGYPGATMDERTAAVMMGLKEAAPGGGGHCGAGQPVSAAASAVTHPAFPMSMPMWFGTSQSPYSLSHLQQFLGSDKALAASQYLAAADPFAKSANPFLDLARMGHYPLGKKLFGCPQCRYITDRKNNLKRHIATMHQECDKALECCGVVFKNKASLRDHVLIFHSNGYMCRFCGRNFCRKALLKRHLTVHSGQKDYMCSQCDYATSHKSNLERHKKVHERQSTDSEDNDLDCSPHKEEASSSTPSFSPVFPGEAPTSTPASSIGNKRASSSPTLAHSTTIEPSVITSNTRLAPSPHHRPSHKENNAQSDDEIPLSPIDVEEDSNALIDVVELAN